MYETARCPRCHELTHPEYLRRVISTGKVAGCTSCLPPHIKNLNQLKGS